MTSIEKVILGVICVIFVAMVLGATYTISAVEEAGGMKAVIIEAGKEIKDIGEQIAKD